MKGVTIRLLITFVCLSLTSGMLFAKSRSDVNSVRNKPAIRGGIVFKHYCALCHGERGDGQARATRLYKEFDLRIKPDSKANYLHVIRDGGKAVGKSDFMPPWQNELSEEQINDVVAYLSLLDDNVKRGEVVYKTNCILCHGINADGKGRAAVLYNPPPANLRKSDKNEDYKEMIVRFGGKAMGRSEVMPMWGDQLSDQEIKDLIKYLSNITHSS